MRQRWHDLLFAHWPVAALDLRRHIPASLEIDTFDGQAWLGIVPFRMSGVRPRFTPALPWLSAFPELNVRTYVRDISGANPRPGVFFFSLEAANPVAVALARRWFHLPYFRAQMGLEHDGDAIVYHSRRVHRHAPSAEFQGRYRPVGDILRVAPDSLDSWLTARYCLYTTDRDGHLLRGEIDHRPWPLQPAEAEFMTNTMAISHGLVLPAIPPVLHFSRFLDVHVWPLVQVSPSPL